MDSIIIIIIIIIIKRQVFFTLHGTSDAAFDSFARKECNGRYYDL